MSSMLIICWRHLKAVAFTVGFSSFNAIVETKLGNEASVKTSLKDEKPETYIAWLINPNN